MSSKENPLEEGTEPALDFQKIRKVADCGQDLVPVAVQDAETGEVLILAYVNRQALDYSVQKGVAAFWSTSRNELWVKGAGSGDVLDLVEIRVNCEQNSLLYLVRPRGKGACHTRDAAGTPRRTCYYRRLKKGKLEHLG